MTAKGLLLPVLVLVAAAYGSKADAPTSTMPSSGPRPGRPECPHDWDFKSGQMAVVGPKINVPEFHDCQRFIVATDSGLVYDSLYAIFATHALDSLDTNLGVLDSSHAGHVALPAAEIYAEGVYLPLGIRTMFSCLYLYRDSVWRARMVPKGSAESDCSLPIDPSTVGGASLEVHRIQLKDFSEQDYPAVARWDWDPRRRLQVIGVKCGRAWCEVGQPGFITSQPTALPPSVPEKLRRTRMIKGWYDEQILATLAPDGSARPSGIWGRIYPDSGLDDYDTVRTFRRGIWVHVADVALTRPATLAPNPYKARLNFDFTGPDGPFNAIFLCRGSQSECEAHVLGTCDGDGQWWAKVIDATPADSSSPRFMCEIRRAHDGIGVHVAGTARWRWLASDETTWKRCVNGCCELTGVLP